MTRRLMAIAVSATLVLAAAACAKKSDSSGSSDKTLVIGVDLPYQGSSADTSNSTFDAMQLYLDQQGGMAGKYKVELKKYDDSTAAAGKWDDAKCKANATEHSTNANEVAVMGTYNSGCAQLEIPVLNQDPSGPMLMVSHANTNPGLTKPWDPGTPDKYYPTGVRNYARVITTDDYQGQAAAQFAANDLHVKRCFVLNDNQVYGQGIARAFVTAAKKLGITILGNKAWDVKQPSYASIFQGAKSSNPDCVYVAGIYDENGGQVVKDKVAVLGDNTKVKMMGPDGFTGYPDSLDKQPEAQGMYMTFAGLSTEQLVKGGGAAAKLIDAYKAKYNKLPATNYALYGVAAVQVILAAIAKSDGTRKSINDAAHSGIDIPADQSVLGKEIKIDPKTGDTSNRDISVLFMKNNQETFFKAEPVQ